MRNPWPIFIKLWDAAQVELHGSYTTPRVLELAAYDSSKAWFHKILVLVGTPLPCLVVTVLIDVLPLNNPSEGVENNTLFLARDYYKFLEMTFFVIHQFRIGARALPFPMSHCVGYSIVLAALSVGVTYAMTKAIGFPLPFSTLAISPLWLALIFSAMVIEWIQPIRQNPARAKMIIDMIKLWLSDTLLACVYPVYFYVFTTLSDQHQTTFSILLPVIKLCMRNLFAGMAAHLGDETPEIVVFNAELFNSLFVSYCMQNSPSFMTTLLMTIANAVTMAFSLRDITIARQGFKAIERQIDEERNWSSFRGRISYNISGGRALTTLERASTLLQQEENQTSARVTAIADTIRISSFRDPTLEIMGKVIPTSRPDPPLIDISANEDLPAVFTRNVPITLRYTCKVRQLLYMAEFLILLKYVEVIIPLVFAIHLITTYHLPNRDYYAVFDGMSQNQLIETLGNVMFYCSLQVASLLLLMIMLKKMLGLPPTRQLAFVLEKQFHWVQTSLIFWVFYNVQASLQHSGYDYSFQFAWLSASRSSGSETT